MPIIPPIETYFEFGDTVRHKAEPDGHLWIVTGILLMPQGGHMYHLTGTRAGTERYVMFSYRSELVLVERNVTTEV